ncbi:hypothetical protein EVAR_14299_1 [Eumeta japonica]|uniref:Uncharacterized protein n=1 Tax=Eumeta variegata TaxID=151549 RepID=A0A4C1UM16_EUMVA|nr:hypothetical protein EVAR_14299_1 [Eumeta japonica]
MAPPTAPAVWAELLGRATVESFATARNLETSKRREEKFVELPAFCPDASGENIIELQLASAELTISSGEVLVDFKPTLSITRLELKMMRGSELKVALGSQSKVELGPKLKTGLESKMSMGLKVKTGFKSKSVTGIRIEIDGNIDLFE